MSQWSPPEAALQGGGYETAAAIVSIECKCPKSPVKGLCLSFCTIYKLSIVPMITGDSGVYSSPNSPDLRPVSGHQRSPGTARSVRARFTRDSSDDTERRKTSRGSFSEALAGLFNLPSEVRYTFCDNLWNLEIFLFLSNFVICTDGVSSTF